MKTIVRFLFITLFFAAVYYIVAVETERYESKSITLLKDLSKKQSMELNQLLIGQFSSTMQDSKVLELYIRSHEMYNYIDQDFNLTHYYASDILDFAQRLYSDSLLPQYRLNSKNLLNQYNKDLKVFYDDPSGTLELTFIHADPKKAQAILTKILEHAEDVINQFAKENAQIALKFLEKQRKEKREEFIENVRKLIAFQNKHHTIDPSVDVERKINIMVELETELIQREVEYSSKLKTWNPNGREMLLLKETIRNLKRSLAKVQKELSGQDNDKEELNTNVFEFQILKNDMEFSKEVYRQTLINQEEVKIEVAQQAKHLVIVAKPTLADDYSYPNKLWDIFTVLMVLFFIYSIITAIITIVQSHQD